MRKTFVLLCMTLGLPLTAFAYYGRGYYGREYETDSLQPVYIFLLVVYIIVSIIFIVRWWMMTSDIKEIRKTVVPHSKSLVYLINIGEKELAEKEALKQVVDSLNELYYNYTVPGPYMDKMIQENNAKLERLNISLPDYVSSGAKFIEHMNALTGRNTPYDNSGEEKSGQAE